MLPFVLWALTVFGLVYLITASAILSWWRRQAKRLPFIRGVVSCAPCTSFWVGLVLGLPQSSHSVFLGGTWDSLLYIHWSIPFWLDHMLGAFIAIGMVSTFQFATMPIAEEEDEDVN